MTINIEMNNETANINILCIYNNVTKVNPVLDPSLRYPVVGRCLVEYKTQSDLRMERTHNVYKDLAEDNYFIEVNKEITVPIENIEEIEVWPLDGLLPRYISNGKLKTL